MDFKYFRIQIFLTNLASFVGRQAGQLNAATDVGPTAFGSVNMDF